MNLIILDSALQDQRLPRGDRRAEHIRKILKKGGINELFVGLKNGPLGKAKTRLSEDGDVALEVTWCNDGSGGALYPLTLLVGMSRPQTCRKILRSAAPIGIREIRFFSSGKGEAGYASSSLWSTGEWERQLLEGVEQSFSTAFPRIEFFDSLESALSGMPFTDARCVACDNYESTCSLGEVEFASEHAVLAIGSERGWSSEERCLLRERNFILADMGGRVMRTETAIVAATSMVASKSGWHQNSIYSASY